MGLSLPSAWAGIDIEEFKAQSNAHRLRIAERGAQLLRNPDFIRQFPEFRSIAKRPQEAVEALLSHDSNKDSLSSRSSIMRTLTENYGVNYRSLPVGSPQRVQIESAANALTRLDAATEAKEIAKRFHSKEAQKALTKLMHILDLHDTAVSRGIEMGSKLQPASQWVVHNPELRSLAHYVEATEPTFKHLDLYNSATVREHGFRNMSQTLVSSSKGPSKPIKIAKAKGKGLSKVGKLVTPVLVGMEVMGGAHNPDRPVGENLVIGLTGTSSTSDCQTLGCNQFFNLCKNQLGVESGRDECIDWFFQHPLDVQENWRRDIDLNNIMSEVSKGISNLTCEERESETVIHFDLRLKAGERQSQRFKWPKPNSQKQRVIGIVNPKNGEINERILFNGAKPSLVQKCSTPSGSSCSNHSAASVSFVGLIAPRSHRVLNLMEVQGSKLNECCQSERCQRYFEKNRAPEHYQNIPNAQK